ncbi:MAG: (d)CMP kinase [Anaerolinea sp.]|nr:(d)CMP kinase [Anaerolinea sp.]
MTVPEAITIDGPASSGKSTVGAILARDLNYLYFDTGVMYRAVTLGVLQSNISMLEESRITTLAEKVVIDIKPPSKEDTRQYDVLLNGVDVTWKIRTREVDQHVSQVSAYAGVRKAMTFQQRQIGLRGKVVMVGRDIGTIVLPEAKLKIYLDASAEVRAMRRYQELINRGEQASYENILAGLRKRDEIDSTRKIAPLKPAEDAVIIDTDQMTVQEVVERIKAEIR